MGFFGDLCEKVTDSLCNITGFVKEHDTQILTATGVIAGIGAVGTAIWATTKVDDIIEDLQEELIEIVEPMELAADDESLTEDEYEDIKKAGTVAKYKCYAKHFGKIGLLYLPTVILEGYSAFATIKVDQIWTDNYNKLEKAAMALGSTFAFYRKNVVENFGEDTDEAMLLGYKRETIEKTVTDENGKKKKVKEDIWTVPEDYDIKNIQKNGLSRLWNKSTAFNTFSNDGQINRWYLQGVLEACQRELETRGYLYLNDVLKRLDMEYEDQGQDLGWVWDPNGDLEKFGIYAKNKIDFGLDNLINNRAWSVTDPECDALLTFNVDGVIRPMLKQLNMCADLNGRAIEVIEF